MQPEEANGPARLPAEAAGPEGSAAQARKAPVFWQGVQRWDSRLSIAKGLTVVTLLTGFFGGYFQYLNAYDDKVSAQAKADMADATNTFIDISNSYAEVQMLQQLMYANYVGALNDADPGSNAMITTAGQGVWDNYVKARTNLRLNSNVFARKAEIYIDWASDLSRDPANTSFPDQDPLNESLLDDYNFDCRSSSNFPQRRSPKSTTPVVTPPIPSENNCTAPEDQTRLTTSLCAIDAKTRKTDPSKAPITIDWQSSKHHVIIMHYCFEALHHEIETVRIWASKNEVSDKRKSDFVARENRYRLDIDEQIRRLDVFMSLAMSQLERIRVKYRPSGFFCHVPLLRDAIGAFSDRCTPVRTARG